MESLETNRECKLILFKKTSGEYLGTTSWCFFPFICDRHLAVQARHLQPVGTAPPTEMTVGGEHQANALIDQIPPAMRAEQRMGRKRRRKIREIVKMETMGVTARNPCPSEGKTTQTPVQQEAVTRIVPRKRRHQVRAAAGQRNQQIPNEALQVKALLLTETASLVAKQSRVRRKSLRRKSSRVRTVKRSPRTRRKKTRPAKKGKRATSKKLPAKSVQQRLIKSHSKTKAKRRRCVICFHWVPVSLSLPQSRPLQFSRVLSHPTWIAHRV